MKEMMLGLLACVLSLQCFANSISELDSKLYVAPGSVYVAPNAIYVNMDGNLIQVNGIATDTNGIYIQDYECRIMKCLRCGEWHDSHKKCRIIK
jgi:hypothetical protein